ncbi:MAG: helix-turn-helix domain-containing protein [Pseudoflavonifractor sp.]|nr:helix-turn-helix domain-containing protein [Pseudoflavonifractor sp.]MDY3019374.1 helix-turn-helix transcriptional regulator [Oscillospiraceae bacterium]
MNTTLTIQEKLKDLRVERRLTLEQLAEQTGLSKSALGKYENDDLKDISPFAIVTLAKFYEVSTDYLLGMTEQKNHPNAELDALHLSDDAIDVLKEGKFNKRLLSEIFCHKDFQGMMLDAELYVDRIADSHIQTLNASVDALRAKLSGEQVDDLWLRTLGKSHINEDEYFGRAIYDDLAVILKGIQTAHMADKTTADEISEVDRFKRLVSDKDNEFASEEEKLLKTFCAIMDMDEDTLEPEEFRIIIKACQKSKSLKDVQSRRGKTPPYQPHGKGRKKRK